MTSFAGRRVWICGGSSGIGAALARELAGRGAAVAISGRRREALEAVAGDRMAVVPVDVTDRAAVREAAATVHERLGGLDCVISSAGAWHQMSLDRWDPAAFDQQVDTNLRGLVHLVEATLPGLRRQRRGTLVGLTSVAGYRGMPRSEAYGATKAASINFLESLRIDLWGTGVDVVTVCPGFVRTPMTDANAFRMPWLLEPDDAARRIVRGLEKGKLEIVFPLPMQLAMKAARLVPVRPWAWFWGRGAARG